MIRYDWARQNRLTLATALIVMEMRLTILFRECIELLVVVAASSLYQIRTLHAKARFSRARQRKLVGACNEMHLQLCFVASPS